MKPNGSFCLHCSCHAISLPQLKLIEWTGCFPMDPTLAADPEGLPCMCIPRNRNETAEKRLLVHKKNKSAVAEDGSLHLGLFSRQTVLQTQLQTIVRGFTVNSALQPLSTGTNGGAIIKYKPDFFREISAQNTVRLALFFSILHHCTAWQRLSRYFQISEILEVSHVWRCMLGD